MSVGRAATALRFGGYEAVEELVRLPFATVYRGRRAGSQEPPSLLIKAYVPAEVLEDDAAAAREGQRFLERARIQQRAAESGAHWAPIHEAGQSEQGPYYVSTFYPSSLLRLTKGHIHVNARLLHAITESILQGLVELRTSCGQPHGDLRPAVVLLPPQERSGGPAAVLAEPLVAQAARAVGETGDLRALGGMIHQLVLGRPFRAGAAYPVEPSAEWTRLGAVGKRWLAFCNRLLDPAPPEPLTLDGALADVRALRPTHRKAVAGSLGVVLLLAALSVGVWWKYFHVPIDAKWADVCLNYYGWICALSEASSNSKIMADPTLGQIAQKLNELIERENVKLNPTAFGPPFEFSDYLTKVPRDSAQLALVNRAWTSTRDLARRFHEWDKPAMAMEDLDRLKKKGYLQASSELQQQVDAIRLRNPVPDQPIRDRIEIVQQAMVAVIESRQVLKDLDDGAAAALKLGNSPQWPAADLPQRLDAMLAAGKPAAQIPFDELKERARAAREALDDITKDWSAVEPVLVDVGSADDPFLKDACAVLRDAIAAPIAGRDGISSIKDNLAMAVKQVGPGSNWEKVRKILPAYATTYDLEAFRQEGAFKSSPAQTLSATTGQLGQWIEAIEAYRKITEVDPRLAVRQKLTELKNDVAARRQTGQLSAEKLTELKVDESLAAMTISSKPWVVRYRSEIEREASGLGEQLAAIIENVRRAGEVTLDEWQKFIALENAFQVRPAASAWAEQWKKWWQPGWNKTDPKSAKREVFDRISRNVAESQAFLQRLLDGTELPRVVEVSDVKDAPAGLAKAVQGVADGQYETRLARVLAVVDWQKPGGAKFDEEWAAVCREHTAFLASARQLVVDAGKVQRQLDAGVGLEDALVKALPARVEKEWPATKASLDPLLKRIAALEALVQASSPDLVKAGMESASPEIPVAAWGLLRKRTDWPSSLSDWSREKQIRQHIAQTLKTLDAARKDELSAGAREFLARYYATLKDPAQVQDLLRAMDEELIAAAPPRLKFNVELARLKQMAAKLQDDSEKQKFDQQKQIEEGTKLVAAFSGGVDTGDQDIQQFVSTLKKACLPPRPDEQVGSKLGPLAARMQGWKEVTTAEEKKEKRSRFALEGTGAQLAFIQLEGVVEPDGTTRKVFLCTVETSIAMFTTVMQRTGKRPKDFDLDDQNKYAPVPTPWIIAGNRLQANIQWANNKTDLPGQRAYADGVNVDRPSVAMPMQNLTPPAAMSFAHLLGCRLPTSAEWRAALARDRVRLLADFDAWSKARTGPVPINLRDGTWKRQFDFYSDQKPNIQIQMGCPDSRSLDEPAPGAGGANAGGPERPVWTADRLMRALTGRDGGKKEPLEDGVLWFQEVGTSADRFVNLVGNVAELVWDAPAELDDAARAGQPQRDLAWFDSMVGRSAGKLQVIGGSALTAPADEFAPRPISAGSGWTWCDVGFRLAYTARAAGVAEQIADAAQDQKFLLAR